MNAENAIESHHRKLSDVINNEFENLYESIKNDKLRVLFSTLHSSCSGQLILATVLESWYLTSDSFGAKSAL